MGGLNKAMAIGHLGRDPELRYTQSGTAVCNFSLAVSERQKKGEELVDHTEWLNISVFGKSAENAAKYLAKGSQAYVEGRIQTRKWKDKDGKDRYTTEIVANNVQYLGGGKSEDKPKRNDDPPEFDPSDDSSIPF